MEKSHALLLWYCLDYFNFNYSTLMKPNKIKKLMLDGKPVVNGWLQIPSSFSAEVMANQGWDSLTIDMQHGVID